MQARKVTVFRLHFFLTCSIRFNGNMEKTLFYNGSDFDCEINIAITEHNSFKKLSIIGVILKDGEQIEWGQVREEARDIIPARLYQIWKRWHLNDMRAGTSVQEALLRRAKDKGVDVSTYEKARNYLLGFGLLVDQGHRYGSAWLKEKLPQHVIDYLIAL